MSRYEELLHAMQSGVAMKMNYEAAETTPKHLRVGVNAAMSDHAALVRLLIDKGVFRMEEYQQALEEEMAREVKRYEEWLNTRLGAEGRITLG
jgi:hypothetical protein